MADTPGAATSPAPAVEDWVSVPHQDDWVSVPHVGAFSRFVSGAGEGSGISTMWQGLKHITGWDRIEQAKDQWDKGNHGQAVMTLLDTAVKTPAGIVGQDLLNTSKDQASKAVTAVREGRYNDAFTHANAALLPIVAPSADAVERIKQPNADVPHELGVVFGNLGSLAAPELIKGVPSALRGAADSASDILQSSAERQYARVLNATTKANKARTAEVVPGLLDRGVTATTMKGLQSKIASQIAEFGQRIGDAYESLPDDAAIPVKEIQERLKQSAKEAFQPEIPKGASGAGKEGVSPSPLADTGISHAEDLAKRMEDYAVPDENGNLAVPAKTARELRQYYDNIAQQAGRYDAKQLADHSIAEAHGMAADAIRNVLAEQFPDIADLNREYSFWRDAGQIVSDTLLRRQGQAKPLGRKIMKAVGIGTGAATGGVHGAVTAGFLMDGLEGAMTSPAWGTVSAVLKSRLANALAFDDIPAAAAATQEIQRQVESVHGGQTPESEPPAPAAVRNEPEPKPQQPGASEATPEPETQVTTRPISPAMQAYFAQNAEPISKVNEILPRWETGNPNQMYVLRAQRQGSNELTNKNAGDITGLTNFLFSNVADQSNIGDSVALYKVERPGQIGSYQAARQGAARGGEPPLSGVGQSSEPINWGINKGDSNWYSFGPGDWRATKVAEVPLSEVRGPDEYQTMLNLDRAFGDALGPNIPRATNLTPAEQAVEQRFAQQVRSDPRAALEDYRSRYTRPSGTLEINTDNARELSPDYSASNDARTAYARAVHEPASWIAKQLYQEELAKPAPEGTENRVVFTAGGTGAGKTTGMRVLPDETPPQMIYDTNSNNFESAKSKIDAALSAGKTVDVRYVHRLPEDAFESMLERAQKTGRPVPMESHIETHVGAPQALVQLADSYKNDPRVRIMVIDNTGASPQGAKIGSIEALRNVDYTGLGERLSEALERHREAGDISPALYAAVKGQPIPVAGAGPAGIQTEPAAAGGAGAGRPAVSQPTEAGLPESPPASRTEVLIPGTGRSIPATYRLRELSDIQASHNGNTFQPNPKYEYVNDRDYTRPENQQKVVEGALPNRFLPQLHITDNPDATNGPIIVDSHGNAIGGNGRTMMLQRVYGRAPQAAKAYRDLLTQKAAQFGVDPTQLTSMKQPVLVREISDQDLGSAQDAITDLNKTGTAALRPAERAIADSRRVSEQTLSDVAERLDGAGPTATLNEILSGKDGPQVLQRLIDDGVIGPQERAQYQSGMKLTDEGKTRISKLLLGRFFRDPAQLDSLSVPMRNKMERLAAPLARTEVGGADWSLTPKIQDAMDLIEEAKAHAGTSLDDFISQSGLFKNQQYSPETVQIAKALQSATQKSLVSAVNEYAQDAAFASKGEGLFGQKPDPAESLDRALSMLESKTAREADIRAYAAQKHISVVVARKEFEEAGYELVGAK